MTVADPLRHSSPSPRRALCVLSEVLGNRTYSRRLREAVEQIDGIVPVVLTVGADDYQRYPAPRLLRTSAPLEAEYVIRKKIRHELRGDVDLVLVNGWEIALALRHLARRRPFIATMDATPRLAAELAAAGNASPGGTARSLVRSLHHIRFRRLAPHVDCWLPPSRWCERSLHRDYGVPTARTHVLYCPIPLDVWTPRPTPRGERMRLLFVGNDFSRKGGDFLLELFATRLASFCELAVASNDPGLTDRALPEHVRLLRGLDTDALLDHYRRADLLIVPTRRDMIGYVFSEANAVGLPSMACDVGGVGELVRSGQNGYLLPIDAGPDEWSARIRYLWEHPDVHAQFRASARELAEQLLDMDDFTTALTAAFGKVLPSLA